MILTPCNPSSESLAITVPPRVALWENMEIEHASDSSTGKRYFFTLAELGVTFFNYRVTGCKDNSFPKKMCFHQQKKEENQERLTWNPVFDTVKSTNLARALGGLDSRFFFAFRAASAVLANIIRYPPPPAPSSLYPSR